MTGHDEDAADLRHQREEQAALDGLVCEVCNGESGPAIGVACSSLGAISFAYCRPCIVNHAEPYGMLRTMILWDCGGMENAADWTQGLTTWHEGRYISVAEIPPLTDEERAELQRIDDEYASQHYVVVTGPARPGPNDHKPNFRDEDGSLYLVRCFVCDPEHGRENYAPAAASGTCAWCGWTEAGRGEP